MWLSLLYKPFWVLEQTSWSIGVTTIYMHTTLLLAGLSSTFQWAVFRDLTAVIFHGCHQSVVHGVFKFSA